MYISDFKYYRPITLKEALNLLEKSNNGALIAGGTDLLVELKQGLRHHEDIISLADIDILKGIEEDSNTLIIGAGVTHNELTTSHIINKNIPAISDAASKIGSEQIRNKGTIGGNLCTAASCCDLGPILIALNASVEIANSKGNRTILVNDFLVFHRKTLLEKGDIITKIIVPNPSPGTGLHFEKFGLREAAAVSVASVAVMVKIENNSCTDARIVIGAVAPTPKISDKSTEILIGKKITDFTENSSVLTKAGNAAADDARPLDDIRGSKKYRKNILCVLTKRAIIKATEFARNTQKN